MCSNCTSVLKKVRYGPRTDADVSRKIKKIIRSLVHRFSMVKNELARENYFILIPTIRYCRRCCYFFRIFQIQTNRQHDGGTHHA